MPPDVGGKPKPAKAEGHELRHDAARDKAAKLAILGGERHARGEEDAPGAPGAIPSFMQNHSLKNAPRDRGANQKQLNYPPRLSRCTHVFIGSSSFRPNLRAAARCIPLPLPLNLTAS